MADKKISQLTAATLPLAGTEVLPIVQSSTTDNITVNNLAAGNLKSQSTTGVLQVSGPSAGATRVMTTPDANFTAARTDAGQTFTGNNTVSGVLSVGASGSSASPFSTLQFPGYSTAAQLRAVMNNNGAQYIGIGSDAAGNLILGKTNDLSGVSPTAFATFSQAGDITVNTGNLVQGTAAKGINFTANTPAAGKTSQLLNWYEEGTWTPTFTNLTVVGTPTYTGHYTRIGRQVSFTLRVQSTTSTSSSALGTYFSLPFSPAVNSTVTAVNRANDTSYGAGFIAAADNAYPPTWAAAADVVLSGFYFV